MNRRSKSSGINIASSVLFGSIFILGVVVGIAFSSTTTLSAGNVASSVYIDSSAPNPEICVQYGASAVVMETRTFLSLNPFSVYVSQPKMQPGCILRMNNWAILEQKKLVNSEDVRQCRQRMNTFGFTGSLDESPEIDCVYQTDAERNSFPNNGVPKDTEQF
ncbi:MAG: DUF3172 domain-containing protein [Coleofasciculaceae cyanobacterium SM2_3_26]|nr:DUF3172 domain-containing protein [Coleofasciculaceae cyanobacterium SM2_3_26]